MKALIINNKIEAKFLEVPKFLKHFRNIQRPDLLSEVELNEKGILVVHIFEPEFDASTHYLGLAVWNTNTLTCTYPVHEIPFNLEEKKQQLMDQLEVAEDNMERLISRCERVNGTDNYGLNVAIGMILQVQLDTRAAIPLLTEETGRQFQIKQSDIDYLTGLLEPYKSPLL